MFNIILFIISPLIIISKKYLKKKLNLIFDLDNTLIVSLEINKYNSLNIYHQPDIKYLKSSTKSKIRVVWCRPMLKFTLYLLNKFTNIYLYTRSNKDYAIAILKSIDIEKYFIDSKYKEDCFNNKDMRIFYPEYKKIKKLEKNIKKLDKLRLIDNISEKIIIKIDLSKIKLKKILEKHLLLMNNFVSRSILIDDLKLNKCDNQELYHIKYFNFGMQYDFELIKLLFYIFYRSYLINFRLFGRKFV